MPILVQLDVMLARRKVTSRDLAEFERRLARVFEIFPRLQERVGQRGGTTM